MIDFYKFDNVIEADYAFGGSVLRKLRLCVAMPIHAILGPAWSVPGLVILVMPSRIAPGVRNIRGIDAVLIGAPITFKNVRVG